MFEGKKVINNAAWIIGVRIVQSVLALIISMITARYLGPSDFGLVNYAASIVAFAVPIMKLGLCDVLVHEFVSHRDKEGETLGTALCATMISSVFCILGILTFTLFVNVGETETIIVTVLYSFMLLGQALEMGMYWFQYKLLSKYTSLITFFVYIVISAYKIYVLVINKNVRWFALSNAFDYTLIGLIQFYYYKRLGGQQLSVSLKRFCEMFKNSKYFIISGMMVAVFAQTDRVMLKLMIGNEATGFYSAAATCAGLTSFVFTAIIDSASPVIFSSKFKEANQFEENIKKLYSVVIFLALAQSVVFTLFAGLIIRILYGEEYGPAVLALRIIVWYTTFSYIGAVRNRWILANQKQNLIWKIDLSGAIANVVLNFGLIYYWGIYGAAMASLITQIFTNVVMGWIIPDIRPNNRMMAQSLNPKVLITMVKSFMRK